MRFASEAFVAVTKKIRLVTLLIAFAVAGCESQESSAQKDDLLNKKLELQKLDTDKKGVQRADLDDDNVQSGIEAGVPESLLEKIRQDAARLSSTAPEDVRITSARAVVWSDGSLGCPAPDQAYTQAVVKGFHVLAAVGLRKFDYRVAGGEHIRLCDPRVVHNPDIRQ
jgi:hypothetical protein